MKKLLLFPFLFLIAFCQAQLPSKEHLQIAFSGAYKHATGIDDNSYNQKLLAFLIKADEKAFVKELESEQPITVGKKEVHPDLYYNLDTKVFTFQGFVGDWSEDGNFMHYAFVIKIEMRLDEESQRPTVFAAHLYSKKSQIKKWWEESIKTYQDPIFARNQIAEAYGLVPPPPPPPPAKE